MVPETLPRVPEPSFIVSALLPVIPRFLTSNPSPPEPASIVNVLAALVLNDGNASLITFSAAMVCVGIALTVGEGVLEPSKMSTSVAAVAARGVLGFELATFQLAGRTQLSLPSVGPTQT